MIPSFLPRAALGAVVAAASLGVCARAQSDSAFSSALGAPVSFASLAQFKAAGAQKSAAAPKTVIAADEASWKQVLETVKRDGKYKPESGLMPGSFSIEESSGDPKGAHTVQEVSFLGMLNDDEKFEVMGAMFAVRRFTLEPNGNFRVDVWMFETDVYGEVDDAGHAVVIQAPDGKPVSTTADALKASDPRIKAQFDAQIKHWAERKPKGN